MSRWGWYDDDDDKDPGYDNGYGAGFSEGYKAAKEVFQPYVQQQAIVIERLRKENDELRLKLQETQHEHKESLESSTHSSNAS